MIPSRMAADYSSPRGAAHLQPGYQQTGSANRAVKRQEREIPRYRLYALQQGRNAATQRRARNGTNRPSSLNLEAENGEVALERLAESPVALILLDLMMPVMDGFECLSALQTRDDWRRIPVVIVTAKDLSAEERRRLSGQAAKILEKTPYLGEDLISRIREVTGVTSTVVDAAAIDTAFDEKEVEE